MCVNKLKQTEEMEKKKNTQTQFESIFIDFWDATFKEQ